MKNIEFKRFTNREVLKSINHKHLARFFDLFKDDLAGNKIPMPDAPPGTEPYLDAWLAILKSPEKLPQRFVNAIQVIENLAAPELRHNLVDAVRQHRAVTPWLNPHQSPECLALQVWLLARYADQDWMKEDPNSGPGLPPAANGDHSTKPAAVPNGDMGVPPELTNNQPSTSQPSSSFDPQGPAVPPESTNHPPSTPQPSSNFDDPDFAFPGSSFQEDAEFGPCSPNEPSPAQPSPAQLSPAQPSTLNSQPLPEPYHRHTGRIGRLPAEIREQINLMIHDGVPYATIITRLGEYGKGLKHYHLSRWKTRGGYPEWCKAQERKDLARSRDQFALDMLRETDAGKVHEASLQIAASRLCQFLADFDPGSLTEKVHSDPQNYVRLLNVLPKLTASGVKAESHRVEMAERRQALSKAKNPPRVGLSEEARRHIEEYLFDPPPH